MSRGTNEQFDELHSLTLTMLLVMMKKASKGLLVDDDNVATLPPPALMAQAIKFLKENGIDKPAANTNKTDTLAEEMPDLDDLERGTVVPFARR